MVPFCRLNVACEMYFRQKCVGFILVEMFYFGFFLTIMKPSTFTEEANIYVTLKFKISKTKQRKR